MSLRDLYDKLLYQVNRPAVTTMGPCANGCGKDARGSGVCAYCVACEMDKSLRGDGVFGPATEFVIHQREATVKRYALDQAIAAAERKA